MQDGEHSRGPVGRGLTSPEGGLHVPDGLSDLLLVLEPRPHLKNNCGLQILCEDGYPQGVAGVAAMEHFLEPLTVFPRSPRCPEAQARAQGAG